MSAAVTPAIQNPGGSCSPPTTWPPAAANTRRRSSWCTRPRTPPRCSRTAPAPPSRYRSGWPSTRTTGHPPGGRQSPEPGADHRRRDLRGASAEVVAQLRTMTASGFPGQAGGGAVRPDAGPGTDREDDGHHGRRAVRRARSSRSARPRQAAAMGPREVADRIMAAGEAGDGALGAALRLPARPAGAECGADRHERRRDGVESVRDRGAWPGREPRKSSPAPASTTRPRSRWNCWSSAKVIRCGCW